MPERLLLAVPVIEKRVVKTLNAFLPPFFQVGRQKADALCVCLECDAANFARFACAFINIKERSVPFDRPARYLKMLGHVG